MDKKLIAALTRLKTGNETEKDMEYIRSFPVNIVAETIDAMSEATSRKTPRTSWHPNHGKIGKYQGD